MQKKTRLKSLTFGLFICYVQNNLFHELFRGDVGTEKDIEPFLLNYEIYTLTQYLTCDQNDRTNLPSVFLMLPDEDVGASWLGLQPAPVGSLYRVSLHVGEGKLQTRGDMYS